MRTTRLAYVAKFCFIGLAYYLASAEMLLRQQSRRGLHLENLGTETDFPASRLVRDRRSYSRAQKDNMIERGVVNHAKIDVHRDKIQDTVKDFPETAQGCPETAQGCCGGVVGSGAPSRGLAARDYLLERGADPPCKENKENKVNTVDRPSYHVRCIGPFMYCKEPLYAVG